MSKSSRVLIVKLSALGDVVHSLPLLEALRAGLGPEAHLAWAVRKAFVPLLEGNPHLSAIHVLESRGVGEAIAFGKKLQKENFDTALDPQGLFLSGLIARLSGARRRIGWDLNREGNRLFMSGPSVPGRVYVHQVEKLLGFCDALGVPRLAAQRQDYLADGEAEVAERLLASVPEGVRIGCVVGTSSLDKNWPPAHWIALMRLLADRGLKPILLGGPGEKEAAEFIVRESGGAVAANLTGATTIRQLASVLARCDVVVGGDTGPFHLAVAVATPTVGLYGTTDPHRVGPTWGPAPAIALDYVKDEAPPEKRRTRHPLVEAPLSRIPPEAVCEALETVLIATKSG